MHLPSRCPSTVLHDPNPRTATHRCRLAAEARSLQIGASGGQPSSDLALAPNSSLLSLRFVSQPLGGIGDGERRGRMGGDEDASATRSSSCPSIPASASRSTRSTCPPPPPSPPAPRSSPIASGSMARWAHDLFVDCNKNSHNSFSVLHFLINRADRTSEVGMDHLLMSPLWGFHVGFPNLPRLPAC
jgi:hypothetical protein